jgi:hypothetical protein
MDQTTPEFCGAPSTCAENCCEFPEETRTANGLSVTESCGTSVTTALAIFVESAALVAVMTAVCWLETEAGAVYKPLWLTVPSPGLRDQLTALLELPVTVAANCIACVGPKVVVAGLIDTVIGWTAGGPGLRNAMVVTAKLRFAVLRAVMLTISNAAIDAGAV